MELSRLQYYEEYLTRCWTARQYYKDETNKLLYWTGTIFIAMVGATGVFGANKGYALSFSLLHILLFHAVFAVVWCYFLYKQLNVDFYECLGEKLENWLRSYYKMDELRELRCFFGLKSHYLGSHAGHGRSLTKFANIGIVLIYLIVTGVPIFKGSILGGQISVNWQFLVSSVIFAALLLSILKVYKVKRKQVIEAVEADWGAFLIRFPAAKWERVSPKI
jgi:hypothetical protein